MDARERLRRYLEQRRELGESELVLDNLPVEDVMALVDARRNRAPRPSRPDTPAPAAEPIAHADAHERADDRSPMAPPVAPPPSPEVRFDATVSTDWRETLRRAGAMRPDAPRADSPRGESAASPRGGAPNLPTSAPNTDAPLSAPTGDAMPAAVTPGWLEALGVPLGFSAGGATASALEPTIGALPTLEAIAARVAACTRCDLHRTALNPVPGEGNPNAEFVCVGEAPGQSEDEQGRPFVGAAGQLLTKILAAIQLQREEVFICNVLKHRPPGNRDPLPGEVQACEPYLRRQLELIRPRVILALGRFAAQSLLQTATPIGKLRGQIHRYHGIPLIVTYHPAALLRNEAWKRPAWEDVKLARRVLDASRLADASPG